MNFLLLLIAFLVARKKPGGSAGIVTWGPWEMSHPVPRSEMTTPCAWRSCSAPGDKVWVQQLPSGQCCVGVRATSSSSPELWLVKSQKRVKRVRGLCSVTALSYRERVKEESVRCFPVLVFVAPLMYEWEDEAQNVHVCSQNILEGGRRNLFKWRCEPTEELCVDIFPARMDLWPRCVPGLLARPQRCRQASGGWPDQAFSTIQTALLDLTVTSL